jgi:hypothetical protein
MSNLSPNPFGSDIARLFTATGVGDMTPAAAEVSGPDVVVQRVLARITTRKGTVIDCPNDCLDIRDFLRAGNDPQTLAGFQGQLQAEIIKEECVTKVVVAVQYNLQTAQMSISISCQTAAGPFTLTLGVSNLTITLLLNGAPYGSIA